MTNLEWGICGIIERKVCGTEGREEESGGGIGQDDAAAGVKPLGITMSGAGAMW